MTFDQQILKKGFEKFYKEVLKTNLTDKTWKNVLFIISKVEDDPYWVDYRQLASFFAQCGHESMWGFAPIKEIRAKYGTSLYNTQNKYWNSGFFGRGIIQITFKSNYELLSKYVGLNLVASPDLALNPEVSYVIASKGMQLGLFTGKKLNDYINKSKCDYYNARRIVNGTDRAKDIEYYSKCFESVFKAAKLEDKPIPKTFTMDTAQASSEIKESPTISESSQKEAVSDPVVIDSTPPIPTTAFKSLQAYVRHTIAFLSVSGAGIAAKVMGWLQSDTAKWTLIVLVSVMGLTAIVLIINHLWIKHSSEMQREQRAHELTMLELELRADPDKYNVEVRK